MYRMNYRLPTYYKGFIEKKVHKHVHTLSLSSSNCKTTSILLKNQYLLKFNLNRLFLVTIATNIQYKGHYIESEQFFKAFFSFFFILVLHLLN